MTGVDGVLDIASVGVDAIWGEDSAGAQVLSAISDVAHDASVYASTQTVAFATGVVDPSGKLGDQWEQYVADPNKAEAVNEFTDYISPIVTVFTSPSKIE